jgi:hypothetical protein
LALRFRLHRHRGDADALTVAQRNPLSEDQLLTELPIDIEDSRDRPYHPIAKPAVAHNALIFLASHESG